MDSTKDVKSDWPIDSDNRPNQYQNGDALSSTRFLANPGVGSLNAIAVEGGDVIGFEHVCVFMGFRASDGVLPIANRNAVPLSDARGSGPGCVCDAAGGRKIIDESQRDVTSIYQERCTREDIFQVSAVNTALVSVAELVDFGHRVLHLNKHVFTYSMLRDTRHRCEYAPECGILIAGDYRKTLQTTTVRCNTLFHRRG